MKEVVTEEVVKTIEYIGNCPVCGKEQTSNHKIYVDVECKECKDKRINKAIEYLESIWFEIDRCSYETGCIDTIKFKFNNRNYIIETYYEDGSMYIRARD